MEASTSFVQITNVTLRTVEECVEVNDYYERNSVNDTKSVTDHTQWITIRLIFGFLYLTLFTVGFLANTGVIYAVFRNSSLQSARNMFLLNLMIADLFLCLTSIPFTSITVFIKKWIFGSVMCSLAPFGQSVSVMVTAWALTIIALDKYIHIRNPTAMPVSIPAAVSITITLWTVSALVNVPFLVAQKLFSGYAYRDGSKPGGFCGHYCMEAWWSQSAKQIYGTFIMAFQFIVPTLIITFCYWQIFAVVRRDMIVENSQFANSLSKEQRIEALKRKRKINHILVAMVLAFVAAWCPMTLLNIIKDLGTISFITQYEYLIFMLTHITAMSCVIWNPLLFYWLTRQRKKPPQKFQSSLPLPQNNIHRRSSNNSDVNSERSQTRIESRSRTTSYDTSNNRNGLLNTKFSLKERLNQARRRSTGLALINREHLPLNDLHDAISAPADNNNTQKQTHELSILTPNSNTELTDITSPVELHNDQICTIGRLLHPERRDTVDTDHTVVDGNTVIINSDFVTDV